MEGGGTYEEKQMFEGENYEPGSDLRTQMLKSYLDFTDDITEIVRRIYIMRRNLKKSKSSSFLFNNKSIFIGASYKVYQQMPHENRPNYSKIDNNEMSKYSMQVEHSHERRLMLKKNTAKDFFLKYMTKKELKNSKIQKSLKIFDFNDMYKLNDDDFSEFKKTKKKKNLV